MSAARKLLSYVLLFGLGSMLAVGGIELMALHAAPAALVAPGQRVGVTGQRFWYAPGEYPRLSLPGARVQRGDLWAHSWAGFDLVYLFQRPESMARAWAKARAELPPGAWLASLEFAIDGVAAQRVFHCPDGRALWLYRLPAGAGRGPLK